MGYTKLFSSLVTSTIWGESDSIRIVWITMLASANKDGEVQASIPGLARISAVSVEACEEAIRKFLSPDPYSRTKDDEGRRIEPIEGGWSILNYRKYRELASRDEAAASNAERQKRFRDARKRNASVTGVTSNALVTHSNHMQRQRHSTEEEYVEQSSTPTPFEEIEGGVAASQRDLPHELEGGENPEPATTLPSKPAKPDKQAGSSAEVKEVFDYWVKVMGKGAGAKLTSDRGSKVKARLRVDGYSVEQLKRAIDGCKMSEWHQGQNPDGKVWDELAMICRTGSQVETMIGYLAERTRPGNGGKEGEFHKTSPLAWVEHEGEWIRHEEFERRTAAKPD